MPRMIIAAKSVSCRKGVISMAKVIRVRTTTHVRRVGTGTYQVRTTVSNGKSTRTSTKTVRVRWVQHKILKKGEDWMAKNSKQTSKRVASIASKVLRDNRFSDSAKSAAASALAQAPKSKKKWILLCQLSRRNLLLSFYFRISLYFVVRPLYFSQHSKVVLEMRIVLNNAQSASLRPGVADNENIF